MRHPDKFSSRAVDSNPDKSSVKNQNEFCLDWQETFDAAMDIIALISENFEIININKAGYQSLGKSHDEIVGRKCYEVVHGLDAPIEGCSCHQAKLSGKGASSEITDRGRQYLTTASPIYDDKGKFRAFAHTVKDITDITNAKKDLEEFGRAFLEGDLRLFYEARGEMNKDRKPYQIYEPDKDGNYKVSDDEESKKLKEKYGGGS